MPNPYEKLRMACLWDWFAATSELKPSYKHVVELGPTMKSNDKESVHAFEEYPKLCDYFLEYLL
jgi:hypothetical protein